MTLLDPRIGISTARPGETCEYRPDICESHHFKCDHACGNAATVALYWRLPTGEERRGACAIHEDGLRYVLSEMVWS